VTKQAASASQMGRFETEFLAADDNLAALADSVRALDVRRYSAPHQSSQIELGPGMIYRDRYPCQPQDAAATIPHGEVMDGRTDLV
jgi:hypothetical protein